MLLGVVSVPPEGRVSFCRLIWCVVSVVVFLVRLGLVGFELVKLACGSLSFTFTILAQATTSRLVLYSLDM